MYDLGLGVEKRAQGWMKHSVGQDREEVSRGGYWVGGCSIVIYVIYADMEENENEREREKEGRTVD